jgi:hypothetical protein
LRRNFKEFCRPIEALAALARLAGEREQGHRWVSRGSIPTMLTAI